MGPHYNGSKTSQAPDFRRTLVNIFLTATWPAKFGQEAFKTAQEASKMAQKAPGRAQGASKTGQDASQMRFWRVLGGYMNTSRLQNYMLKQFCVEVA